ncbi:MFS transporter [Arthrobacter oryzae]|uniref:MFS transporter n=1 Tax=Arthrobacter oryzae TaxID=409290 RepID=UPI00273C4373|nr:MFS transporter [Arthrobacter oryzae]WLQ07573.1 MFS transporter [Arthrobacter oryzae]
MSTTDKTDSTPQLMSRGLTLLFAVAGGAAVGNLYWSQPLLEFIARDFQSSAATAGWLVTLTQIGYVLGILLVVPLGDVLNRKRVVPLILLCSAVALAVCAAAPSIVVLQAALFAVGLSTVAGQLLVPLAGDLAGPGARVKVVGTVTAGMLTGILLSRTISGFIAGLLGWRAVYIVAAIAAVVFAVVLRRAIPQLEPKTSMPYAALLASLGTILAQHRMIRWTLLLGATAFAVFTMFWTSLTFLLSAAPFSYPVPVIGLFGLAGLAGVITAQRAGWLYNRGWGFPATGAAWAATLLTLVAAALGAGSVVIIILAVIVIDIAIQVINRINQASLFEVSHEARSRLNTLFVTGNFIGGAAGSAAVAVLWPIGGWTAIMVAGSGLCLFGLLLWWLGRRTA